MPGKLSICGQIRSMPQIADHSFHDLHYCLVIVDESEVKLLVAEWFAKVNSVMLCFCHAAAGVEVLCTSSW